MANPYFARSPQFGERRAGASPYPNNAATQGQWGPAQAGFGPAAPQATANPYDQQFQNVQQSFYAPDAGSQQTGRLTYDDVIVKTVGLLAVVVVAALAAWFIVPSSAIVPVMIVGFIGGFVLGLVNAFKKEPSPGLIIAYALFEGAALGAISGVFETMWPGIVVQAVLATFITFGVTLALFKSGKVRVTPKFTRFLMIALISYGIFCIVNLGIMWFTNMGGAFGMRSMTIMGFPIGVVIGLVAVVLAAMSLIVDFDSITRGVKNGLPRKYAWSAAFGLTITLVWLYIEFLRILAILRQN